MSSTRSRHLKVYGSDEERQTWYELAQAKQLTFSRFMRSLLEREAQGRSQKSSKVGLQCCRELARCLTLLKSEVDTRGQANLTATFDRAFALLKQLEEASQ